MKIKLPILLISGLSALLSNAVTFNLSVNFGGSSTISSTAQAYLVANGTGSDSDALTTLSNINIAQPSAPGNILSTGSLVGDYVVIADTLSFIDFTGAGGNGFFLPSLSIDTATIDSDIVAGTDLGIVLIDNDVVYAYSGSDTTPPGGGDAGWFTPSAGATSSIADITPDLGGTLNLPSDLVEIGGVGAVPEPTSSTLAALGLFGLIARRKR